ncbi:MAG: hypothetical protein CL681_22780 [Blastopirellula sp.]|nr:hypothetical protein [Blastopirellula sp.]
MSGSDSTRNQREAYEQAQALFLQSLEITPEDRVPWVLAQSQYPKALQQQVLSMLQADAECEPLQADPGGTTSHQIPETIGRPLPELDLNQPFPEIENYEIIEELARGGMGIVYKAQQLRPQRLAAIKMIRSGMFASSIEIERFMTEANAAAQLDDEAVVPVYELGTVHGEPFIAMKFIDGEDLESVLTSGAISLQETLTIMTAVGQAVACAHQRDIIHRDLKPSNILIDNTTQRPWVTDFGLAKYLNQESSATSAGDIMGTPGYMAPEQALGDVDMTSTATDVYGLGAILYRMLTGRPPIQSEEAGVAKHLQLIQEHEVIAPRAINRRIPVALNTICMKCLETDPARRYAHAGELVDDLRLFQAGEAIQAKPLSIGRRIYRWARHRPGLSITWAAAITLYLYHVIYRTFFQETSAEFHVAVAITVTALCCGAWVWQQCLTRSRGAAWVLYLWLTSDVIILTAFLFSAGGSTANSLIPLYHVMVASSVLRCRTNLVIYTTFLVMVGYTALWINLATYYPVSTPPLNTAIPILISMLLIGVIQYFSLRRSMISLESQSADRLK